MTKKMWAVSILKDKEFICCNSEQRADKSLLIAENNGLEVEKVKLYISDRDPHENVKKLIADYPKFDYTKISLARAIEKDIENTEGE